MAFLYKTPFTRLGNISVGRALDSQAWGPSSVPSTHVIKAGMVSYTYNPNMGRQRQENHERPCLKKQGRQLPRNDVWGLPRAFSHTGTHMCIPLPKHTYTQITILSSVLQMLRLNLPWENLMKNSPGNNTIYRCSPNCHTEERGHEV